VSLQKPTIFSSISLKFIYYDNINIIEDATAKSKKLTKILLIIMLSPTAPLLGQTQLGCPSISNFSKKTNMTHF
jgi:hypothetical protein